MSSTSMTGPLVTSSEADDAILVAPRLPFPFQPLSPVVDFVAGLQLSMFTKSLIGFLGGALLLLIMGAFSLLILSQMNSRVESLSLAQERMDLARQMKNDVTSQMHFRAMALLTGDGKNNEKIANAKASFWQDWNSFESADPRSQLVSFDEVIESSERFDAASQRVLELYESGEIEESMALHLAEEHPISHELESSALLMIEGTGMEWREADAAFASDRRLLTTIVWSFSALSIAAAVFLGIVMSWSYIRPVRVIGSVLSRVAAGDFSQRVKVPNRDEIGSLGTDVNSMSERLNTLYQELEEANRMIAEDANRQIAASEKLATIGQLSAGMAHDLRNPLGAIKNAAYMLNKRLASDGVINDKLKRYIEIIDQQVSRSNDTITELMTFANVQDPELAETHVDEVLEDALEMMDKDENITFSQHYESGLHPVMADREQLQRVFLNLTNNAQEAMRDGGRITITVRNVNSFVEIAVSDTGEGISDENMEKIFDPLFTTKPKGTGLGLAVCQQIVEQHGGTIRARRNDEPSGGSIFEVKLPTADVNPQTQGEPTDDE